VVAVKELLTDEILKPARYLGNELGSVHKDWDTATVRWVLTYPEVYEVGASNLGHIILYSILNAQPRQLCDRAYLPAPDLSAKLRATHTPLFAVESKAFLTEFDILGFSLSYELGATNILEMLNLAEIPLTWQERQQGSYPLIFAGGQTATSNPEPYADFFDFIALGDGEELLPEIGLVLEQGKLADLSRVELLLDLAQVPGVYVPQFYEMAEDGSVHPLRPDVPTRILRRVATPMPAYSIGLVPYIETVHDRLTVEIRRGCTRGCRFCQPGMLTRPARDVEPEEVIESIEEGMRATGYNEFSLLSLSCSDYLALPAVGVEIKNRLKDENISLSLPSQRVDRFDENIANILGGTRLGGLTFAPEAGTQRLRDVVNKGLTNEELLRGVKTAVEQGWDKIKLYFMIGLPGETDEDVLGIAETVRWLQRECRNIERKEVIGDKSSSQRRSGGGRKALSINLTISNFTPKPHTPFQWHSVTDAEFERKKWLLRCEFRSMRNLKANFTDVRISAMEDFVGRGDRRLASVIRRAWELGAGMDSWFESVDKAFGAWERAIAESGLGWKYRQKEEDAATPQTNDDRRLPWDHINTGIDKEWLKADLEKALAAAIVPDCSFDECSHCGVCSVDFGHNIVTGALPIPEFAGDFVPNTDRLQRVRVWFGKLGDLALISHLDLLRLFDRVLRRASLPISFSGGFHPSPRMAIAMALPLGVTSSGEIIDFELTQTVELEEFKQKLRQQLPADLPIYNVAEVDLKAPSSAKLLTQSEYLLTVATISVDESQWQQWIEAIKATDAILLEHTTKSGKLQTINVRSRLLDLALIAIAPDEVVLRYTGVCQNDGTQLRPEQVIFMLEQVAGKEFHLLHIHRDRLLIED
jgi:radical SAM family uncharacterized protein/radical SAM-linked protein